LTELIFVWIKNSQCVQRYNIHQVRQHGEAASANLKVVANDRACIRKILANFEPKDRFNANETALFAFAPPDVGMASKQMSGKKKEKFRITLMFMCNQTGSEKWPIFFIGRSKKPRCFKNKEPSAFGFHYAKHG
jgi:hypothetical protein